MKAPQAKKIEKILETHGDKRIDNYFWLNERKTRKLSNILKKKMLTKIYHERYRRASGRAF
jgi:oligopeptidase B